MNLYLIENSETTLLLTPSRIVADVPDVDGTESILAMARTESDALALAAKHDAGELQADNVMLWNGKVVAALTEMAARPVKLTRTHLEAFMKARHPRLTWNCAADAWIGGVTATGDWGMSETDAWYEAMSEIELWQDGTAGRPAWLDCLIADLIPDDHGDFVTVSVPGIDVGFTMHKHYKIWGTSPEDNRENWCRLCAAAGLDADDHDDVADALNSLFTHEELADPWADDDR
jgi:hypothetical protein